MIERDEHIAAHGTAPFRFLGQALSPLRWVIIAAMLLITLLWPVPGRTGHPIWLFVLFLAAYNLCVETLRRVVPRFRAFAWIAIFDLPVISALYYLDYEPGGPLFVFFYLALITAAATMSLRGTILYTGATLAVIALVAPTLPGWSPTDVQLRQLASRLIVLSLVGVGTAILTRRLALEQEIGRRMRDEAERWAELDRLKNEFIASISHDLRTPITAARAGLGLLELNKGGWRDRSEVNLLNNVRRNIERLNLLIDELLTLNQLQAGVLHLDLEPLNLREIVADAVEAVQPLMREKAQTVEIDIPDPLPVEGDARRLEQMLVNLLANAHQHTPDGTRIAITGRATERSVRVEIADGGRGIPADQLQAIFQRFYRLGSSNGSGLGLAIVRGIVDLHGGRVWAESQPGSGAVFVVTLPLRDHVDAAPANV